jgi:DNA-binding MarR family transcriptional regulator
MNIRITNKKNKVNINLKIYKASIPDEIIAIIEKSRFKYKEGLYRVLGYLLYRAAYGYSMRVSQATIARYLGLTRSHVNEIIGQLRDLNFITLTYHQKEIKPGVFVTLPSSYRISPALRDPSSEFRSKMCYLYPFLAKVSATFFCFIGSLQKRLSKHLENNNPTLYNKGLYIFNSSFYNVQNRQEKSQKGSVNGVENPTPGKDPSLIKDILANFRFPPNIPMPEVRPKKIFYSWSAYSSMVNNLSNSYS